MRAYLDLLEYILENGEVRDDRTKTGTISSFGHQLKFDLSDDRWRFSRCSWDAFYEVPGGMEQTTIYVPFHSFQPRVIGFSVWWNQWIPF